MKSDRCLHPECPDENQIVALLQGFLSDEEIQQIDDAILRCPACFELSMEVARILVPGIEEQPAFALERR